MLLASETSTAYDAAMPKKAAIQPLSQQVRDAIDRASVTRYAISKATGVTEAALSRFVRGLGGLSLESIDRIGEFLRLRIVADGEPPPAKKGTKHGKSV